MIPAFLSVILVGILFGLSLAVTKRVQIHTKKTFLYPLGAMARISMLALFFYIILKSNQIHPIILVVSFLGSYWFTILTYKECIHAKS